MRPTPDGSSHSASRSPDAIDRTLATDRHANPENISGASQRLRALAALSGSLTDALGPKDAADLVEQKALSALDATSAVVVTLGDFPPITGSPAQSSDAPRLLHVVHAIGLPAEVTAALEQLPLGAPVPLAEVARNGQPLFLHSEKEMRRYPDWAAAMIGAGARAAAIVPVWANGELRGVLGLTWSVPRIFDEDECAFVLTLGVMCAQAIMRAHLRAAERTAREEAEAARGLAEEANKSKARLVATISHELRTPMNAILGYTTLLGDEIDGPVNDTQKEHIGRVQETGKQLLGLVDDLLGLARVEAAEEVVRVEPVLLVNVIEESLMLVRPLAEKKGLRIRVEAPPEQVELQTDARKLRQVLVNLLANAVKFTEAGSVVLRLRVEGKETEVRVIFEVTDTGLGIAARDLEHVFDPFWQADPTARNPAGSTGLGLSVARQLARLLGGEVTVTRSVVGEGSTFTVSLPARYAGPVAQADAPKGDALPTHHA
jgi:signal transduction histidine kinase